MSRDQWEGNKLRPQSLNGWSYVEGNSINLTDPTGLYAWFNIKKISTSFQHERIERWFEQEWKGNIFWQAHLEFVIPGFRTRADILYFPTLASGGTSPIDFSTCGPNNRPRGEIYEIEPMYLSHAIVGEGQVLQYFGQLTIAGYAGILRDKIKATDAQHRPIVPNHYVGQYWDFNNVDWRPGTSLGLWQPHVVPMNGQGDIWIISPAPGLILYVDDRVRESYEAAAIILAFEGLAKTAEEVYKGKINVSPSPRPAAITGPAILIPRFFLDPRYDPTNPVNCWRYPDICRETSVYY